MIKITVHTTIDEDTIKRKLREAAERKIRELIQKKLTFPGSGKLEVKVTFGSDGNGKVTFVGDEEVTKEALRRWNAK